MSTRGGGGDTSMQSGSTLAPGQHQKVPSYPWPTGTPTWMKKALDTLWTHGQIAIAPQIMAAIAKAESGFEVKGAGVNAQGYGGFFGLGATQHYPGGLVSSTTLMTAGEASFKTQAKLASDNLWTYVLNASPTAPSATTAIIAAVNHYVGGGGFKNFSKTATSDAQVVWGVLNGHSAATAVNGGGGKTAGGVVPTHLLTIADPLSIIAKDIGYLHDLTFWKRVGIFLGGLALFAVGGIILLNSDKSVRSAEGSAAKAAALA